MFSGIVNSSARSAVIRQSIREAPLVAVRELLTDRRIPAAEACLDRGFPPQAHQLNGSAGLTKVALADRHVDTEGLSLDVGDRLGGFLGDDVDHPGERVRTVGHRDRPLDDFDALDA